MAELDLTTRLGPVTLPNPVLAASGTFGYGEELADRVALGEIGAIVAKTVTRQPRPGNPPPRTCETAAGMLNAIGLQNVGIDVFLREKLPWLLQHEVRVIVNLAGESEEDFADLLEMLEGTAGIVAVELNLSCPNVAHGLDFSTRPEVTERVVRRCRAHSRHPLIAKLSPNVTDIAEIARAAEAGGADMLSMVNTFVGLAINPWTRRPRLANVTGGLSGPAIKPLALRAVYRCAQAVSIPIIGIGGIMSGTDAAEFLLAGASAVQVGTATFVQPDAPWQVLQELKLFLQQQGCTSPAEIVGTLQC